MEQRHISVVGLGYVGLPVAVALAHKGFNVLGYDKDADRVTELQSRIDRTLEASADSLDHANLTFTTIPHDLTSANFHIVAVPTPIDINNEPDLGPLISASKTLSKIIRRGDIVVFESTVYPGCTEEVCQPILEAGSGLSAPQDFVIGYSPERINPGDKEHNLQSITKVISAQTDAALDIIAGVYGTVVTAGLHRASSIQVAEAAKVIENIQRDVNIALINEFSEVFAKLGIDTYDVLTAAKTKWNFLPFEPGLVGGHCIGVDPYYLTHKASKVGVNPRIILAGRETNNRVVSRVANDCGVWAENQNLSTPRIAILGATFKENVPDIRNSQIPKLIDCLHDFAGDIFVFDPYRDLFEADTLETSGSIACKWPISNDDGIFDIVILAVPHKQFLAEGWDLIDSLIGDNIGLVVDIKACLPVNPRKPNLTLKRL